MTIKSSQAKNHRTALEETSGIIYKQNGVVSGDCQVIHLSNIVASAISAVEFHHKFTVNADFVVKSRLLLFMQKLILEACRKTSGSSQIALIEILGRVFLTGIV